MKIDEYTKLLETAREDLQEILTPIYTSGLSIEDYKKVILYLSSLAIKDKSNKKKIMHNWTAPYIESLLLFFSKLENNEELMRESKNFRKH